MTRTLLLRPQAQDDLAGIAAHSRQAWGNEQARRYAAGLLPDIKGLTESALRHPLLDRVEAGLRRRRSGMHHIYYFASDERVEVVRVLHVRRDPGGVGVTCLNGLATTRP